MSGLSRAIINTIMPEGAFWEPKDGSDYDKLLNGIGANSDAVHDDLAKLAWLRDPLRTPCLSDLEKEYGVVVTAGATEADRRSFLKSVMFKQSSLGSFQALQDKLTEAGFLGVFVHVNSPAVDPNIFLAQAFSMECGLLARLPAGNKCECGEVEAQCASIGGELVVNGDLFNNIPEYYNQAGMVNPYSVSAPFLSPRCGNSVSCGDFSGYRTTIDQTKYSVPADVGYWPLFFFVGGQATRDPVTGALTKINFCNVPAQKRIEFRRIILRFKPALSWGAAVIQYN